MRGLMTSLFFDTNALIYWAYSDSPEHHNISKLLHGAFLGNAAVYCLSSSLNDVYCVLRRQYTSELSARDAVRNIAEVFDLVDLTGTFVFESLDSTEPDYEDGLIRAASEALQVDALITYDHAAFLGSFIPKMTADQALSALFAKD